MASLKVIVDEQDTGRSASSTLNILDQVTSIIKSKEKIDVPHFLIQAEVEKDKVQAYTVLNELKKYNLADLNDLVGKEELGPFSLVEVEEDDPLDRKLYWVLLWNIYINKNTLATKNRQIRDLVNENLGGQADTASIVSLYRTKRDKLTEKISSSVTIAIQGLRKQEEEAQELEDIEKIDIQSFRQDRTTIRARIKTPYESFYDLFSASKTSEDIPFIQIQVFEKEQVTRELFKVHGRDSENLPQEIYNIDKPKTKDEQPEAKKSWLAYKNPEFISSIYFYVLTSFERKKLYSRVTLWCKGNRFYIEYSFGTSIKVKESEVKTKLLSCFSYEIQKAKAVKTNGVFVIERFPIEREVFLDLIMNNNRVAGNFISSEAKKGAVGKIRLYFYYFPDWEDDTKTIKNDAVSLLLTQEEDGSFFIRIKDLAEESRLPEVEQQIRILLATYEKEYSKIKKIYDEMVTKKPIKSKKAQKEMITKQMLKQLRSKDQTGMFGQGYSSACSATKQPFILSEEEAQEYGDDYKIQYPENGNYFTCTKKVNGKMVRERGKYGLSSNKSTSKFVYPGLTKIKENPDFMYVPCCFSDKNRSRTNYNKWKGLRGASRKVESILDENKDTKEGTWGRLTKDMIDLLTLSLKKKRDVVKDNILRYGVIQDSQSVIHCLEQATNVKYRELPREKKIELARQKRRELENIAYPVVLQEAYDMSQESIKRQILSDVPLSPLKYIRALEKLYDLTIFLFGFDEEKQGVMVLPRFNTFYLSPPQRKNKDCVLIFINDAGYCEIIGNQQAVGKREVLKKFLFNKCKNISECFQSSVNTYRVFSPYSNNVSFPLSDIGFQYVDELGKCRMLVVNGVYVRTPPLPPFDTKNTKREPGNIKKVSMDTALAFVSSYKLADPDNSKSYNVSESGLYLKKFDVLVYCRVDPLRINYGHTEILDLARGSKKSVLRTYYENYKKAEEIKIKIHYLLENKEEINVVVEGVGNIGIQSNKIIVPDLETKKKVEYYISKTAMLRKPSKNNKYVSIYQYQKHPREMLFISRETLIQWLWTQNLSPEKGVLYHEVFSDIEYALFVKFPYLKKPAIIQNVKDGLYERAIVISEEWKKNKVNLGYYVAPAKEDEVDNYVVTIYDLSGYSEPMDEEGIKVDIYEYDENKYAAILFE